MAEQLHETTEPLRKKLQMFLHLYERSEGLELMRPLLNELAEIFGFHPDSKISDLELAQKICSEFLTRNEIYTLFLEGDMVTLRYCDQNEGVPYGASEQDFVFDDGWGQWVLSGLQIIEGIHALHCEKKNGIFFVSPEQYAKCITNVCSFYRNFIPRLKSGQISRDEFLDAMALMGEQGISLATIHTPDFQKWCIYFRRHFPQNSEASIQHERAHALIAEKYGLSVHYGIIASRPPTQVEKYPCVRRAFVSINLPVVARDWPVVEILKCIEDIAKAVDDPSEGDRAMIHSENKTGV